MTWPTSTIINAVFIPLYTLTLLLNLSNVIKHGRGKTVGFISLLLFSLLHLIGNIMLVYSYKSHYKNINITVWGYILQSIGLSFLLSASLAFYARARSYFENAEGKHRTNRITKLLNLVNIAALICIITGYTSVDVTNAEGEVVNPKLPIQTKVGAVLYVALMVIIALMAAFGLRQAQEGESKVIRLAVLAAVPFLIVRSGWAVYTTMEGTILTPKNIWVKLVLQYVMEFVALMIYTGLGFMMAKLGREGKKDFDVEEVSNASLIKDDRYSNSPSSDQYYHKQQVPITFVQQHRQ